MDVTDSPVLIPAKGPSLNVATENPFQAEGSAGDCGTLGNESSQDRRDDEASGCRVVEGIKIPERYAGLPVKEALRRTRISVGNSGGVPWNKGKKHAPAMLEKIKARTTEAMQRPEVRAKIAGRERKPHSQEAKEKIRSALRAYHDKIRKEKGIEMPAREKPRVKKPHMTPQKEASKRLRSNGLRGRAKSYEHRRRIGEAIRRKWQEPEYRNQMIRRLQNSQQRRLESAMARGPQRAARRREIAEFQRQRQKKFEEASAVVLKLELEINSLEAQRFIHVAEKDMETVAEIDEVLKESRNILEQVKALLTPLKQKMDVKENGHHTVTDAQSRFNSNASQDGSVVDGLKKGTSFPFVW